MKRKKFLTGIVAVLLISLIGFTGLTLLILSDLNSKSPNNLSSGDSRVLTGEERSKAIEKIFENNRGNILNHSISKFNNSTLGYDRGIDRSRLSLFHDNWTLASTLSLIPSNLNNKLEYTKSLTRKGPAICTNRENDSFGLNNSEFESYTFFGDNKSINRNVSRFEGNIYSAYYNRMESNTIDVVEYAGGSYAVKVKSKYPVLESVDLNPESLLEKSYGYDSDISVVKNSLGQDIYAIDTRHSEYCFTSRSENSASDSIIFYRYYYDFNTFTYRGYSIYLNSINDSNLLEKSEVIESSYEDMTFDVANAIISDNFGQPKNKEYLYDYLDSSKDYLYNYGSRIDDINDRRRQLQDRIDYYKSVQLNLIFSDLKDSATVISGNYPLMLNDDKYLNPFSDRSFFISGELGNKLFTRFNSNSIANSKIEYYFQTYTVIESKNNTRYAILGRLYEDQDDIVLIKDFLGSFESSRIGTQPIQYFDLILGTKIFKAKVYTIESNPKQFILIVNDGDKKFVLKFSKYLSDTGYVDIEFSKDLISSLGLRYFAYNNEKDMNDLVEILNLSLLDKKLYF